MNLHVRADLIGSGSLRRIYCGSVLCDKKEPYRYVCLGITTRIGTLTPDIFTAMEALTLEDLAGHSQEPGTTKAGLIGIAIGDIKFDLPFSLVKGKAAGERLVVTAGIHGAEYPCVEAAIRLSQSIDASRLRGEVLIIPSANPVAFRARSIYVTPPDGKNLNRVFPGDRSGTFTEVWASILFEHVISTADAYIDLHGGDMIEALVPFTACYEVENRTVTEKSRLMARSFGIEHVLVHPLNPDGGPSGMTVLNAARAHVPAILAEAGGQGVWNESDVNILKEGVERVLHALNMLDSETFNDVDQTLLTGWSWLRAEYDGLFYPTVAVGDVVIKGEPMGRVADFFGVTLQELTAPTSGVVLFLVTSLAMNQNDPLLAIAY